MRVQKNQYRKREKANSKWNSEHQHSMTDVFGGAGFSLRVLVHARTKPHRLNRLRKK
jgi:hypothetical protein